MLTPNSNLIAASASRLPIEGESATGGGGAIAPWPLLDRYPTILGSRISVEYISAVFRSCLTGYRQQYVDVLCELLERDPGTFGMLQQRINATASGRIEVVPARLPPQHPELDEAKRIAEDVQTQIEGIHDFKAAIVDLLWAIYFSVTAAETEWDKDGDGWHPVALHKIHSRRLAYPDQASWKVRIWDQGAVSTAVPGAYPSERLFGLVVDDYRGHFVTHASKVRGEYPTRDGLGRQIAFWMALKGMAIRGAGQYIERFGKPWPFGYYSTRQADGKPRAANELDIEALNNALKVLGVGALAGAALPDSVEVKLTGPGMGGTSQSLTHGALIDLIDKQIAKAVLTTSGISDVQKYGARSALEVMEKGFRETVGYDADVLAETLKRDLVRPLVHLRRPGKEHLAPQIKIHVDEKPDAGLLLEAFAKAAQHDIPLDADWAAGELGFTVVPNTTGLPRRMRPLKQTAPDGVGDPDEGASESTTRVAAEPPATDQPQAHP